MKNSRIKEAILLIENELNLLEKKRKSLMDSLQYLKSTIGFQETKIEPQEKIKDEKTTETPKHGHIKPTILKTLENHDELSMIEIIDSMPNYNPGSIQSCISMLTKTKKIIQTHEKKYKINQNYIDDSGNKIPNLRNEIQTEILEILGKAEYPLSRKKIISKMKTTKNPNVMHAAFRFLKKHGFIKNSEVGIYELSKIGEDYGKR